MTQAPLPNLRCPLCGEANECAPARSGSFDTPCWCSTVPFAPDAVASADCARHACLCPRCASGAGRRLPA